MLFAGRNCGYFGRSDYLQFKVEAGVLSSQGGHRLIAVNDEWLRGFVAALEHETATAAPGILRRCGEVFGQRLAKRFENEVSTLGDAHLRDRTMNEFCVLLDDFWRGSGMGLLEINWENADRFLSIALRDSPMQDIGPSGHKGDDLFAGILRGFFGYFSDAPVELVQTGDVRLGDREGTTFILGAPEVIEEVAKLREDKVRHSKIVEQIGAAPPSA